MIKLEISIIVVIYSRLQCYLLEVKQLQSEIVSRNWHKENSGQNKKQLEGYNFYAPTHRDIVKPFFRYVLMVGYALRVAHLTRNKWISC